MYGFVETSLQVNNSGNYAKFGLNQNVVLNKFAYNPNGGKDNSQQDCVDIEFQVGDSVLKTRVYEITRAWKDGVEVGKDSETFKSYVDNLSAYLINIASIYVPLDRIKQTLSQATDFKSFVTILTTLVQNSSSFVNKKPVDIFLEWQEKIRGNAEMTYLEIPVPTYGRYNSFISEAMGEGFKEVKDENGLKYVKEDGTVHPLGRNAWFVKNSKKANQQKLSNASTVGKFDNPFELSGDSDDLPF